MADIKNMVSINETMELMDIRIGKVLSVEPVSIDGKPNCLFSIDFGKFGIKRSVGRFSTFNDEPMVEMMVVCVLNFGCRKIGNYYSEVLTLGVQCPKQLSGEAQPLTIAGRAKIGSKVF